MKIEQQGVSLELDELIDANCYEVSFVAQITNTKGIKYAISYQRSHENSPDFRESVRAIVERGVHQYSNATAYCAEKKWYCIDRVRCQDSSLTILTSFVDLKYLNLVHKHHVTRTLPLL